MNNIVLLGGIGVGKDYLLNKVIERYNLNKIVTDTTRPKRDGEINGITYNFIDNNKFEHNLKTDSYIEHQVYNTKYGDWYYGTNKESIKQDNTIVILDKEGYLAYKELVPNCISFYIGCIDDTERFYRALKRLNSIEMKDVEEVYRRIKVDENKFENVYNLVDFTLPQCYNDNTVESIFSILDRILIKEMV